MYHSLDRKKAEASNQMQSYPGFETLKDGIPEFAQRWAKQQCPYPLMTLADLPDTFTQFAVRIKKIVELAEWIYDLQWEFHRTWIMRLV
jgi:hypothetical protein